MDHLLGNYRMPCRWQGKQIVVLDTIIIQEPYTPEKCTAPNNNANALTRVKKVVCYDAPGLLNWHCCSEEATILTSYSSWRAKGSDLTPSDGATRIHPTLRRTVKEDSSYLQA